ncbi:hypothetical protein C8F01DRAFT_1265822 [Mycena amicta]|nr:hypothetical protein C8F01DRAFT_1265822 [Mycena amicta]
MSFSTPTSRRLRSRELLRATHARVGHHCDVWNDDSEGVGEHIHKIFCCIIQLYAVVQVDGAMSPSILLDVAKFTEPTVTRMNLTNIARIEMQTQEYHDQLLALLSEKSLSDELRYFLLGYQIAIDDDHKLPLPQHASASSPNLPWPRGGARIAILGTGGIGKTTLASSVIHHPEIASLFPGDQIYFVPCEGAPTAEELLATIASISALLVLDNFETPWEALGERTGVSKLLGQLAELKNLAIIITMRGAERPTGEDEKSSVYDLLECTGNLPLAITLISSAAADEGCAATLARWHDTKTLVLSDGYDKRSSLDISIGLSLTSAQMTKEALELLSLLAILPDGLGNAELTEALPLAFIDASDRRLKLLVPIREYMAASHPPPAQLKAAIWIYFQKAPLTVERL